MVTTTSANVMHNNYSNNNNNNTGVDLDNLKSNTKEAERNGSQ